MTASAIALKKMTHFRILIPSQNLRGYTRRLESTRQKPHNQSQNSGGCLGCIVLGAFDLHTETANVTISWQRRDHL